MGADAGFASIIGLAVLVLLYFAQARETASLRDQAELAAQRVDQLENRLAHAVSAQQPGVAVAPAPGMPRPGSVIPVPGNQPAPPVLPTAPPAGVAAPPLSAATKLIPTPSVQPPPIGAPGTAAARIAAPSAAPSAAVRSPLPTTRAAGGLPPTAAAPASPGLSPPGAPSPANRIVTPRPVTAAGGATATNGVGEHPPVPPIRLPAVPPLPPRGSVVNPAPLAVGLGSDARRRAPIDLSRVLTAIAIVAVLAAIVVVLLSLTGGSTTHTTSQASTPVNNAPKPTHHAATAKPVNNASVTVGVLNGTAVYHLANSVGTQLAGVGFKEGTIADAANQQHATTSVQYVPGAARDAGAVAKALKLPSSAVQPITPDTQALGCPQTSSCSVVVTVGSDLATASTQTTTTG